MARLPMKVYQTGGPYDRSAIVIAVGLPVAVLLFGVGLIVGLVL